MLDTDRDTTAEYLFQFGLANDIPLAGNLDGQYGDDLAVVRNSGGGFEWYVTNASNIPGKAFPRDDSVRPVNSWFRFGLAGDQVLTGKFDADNIDDIVSRTQLSQRTPVVFSPLCEPSVPNDGRRRRVLIKP